MEPQVGPLGAWVKTERWLLFLWSDFGKDCNRSLDWNILFLLGLPSHIGCLISSSFALYFISTVLHGAVCPLCFCQKLNGTDSLYDSLHSLGTKVQSTHKLSGKLISLVSFHLHLIFAFWKFFFTHCVFSPVAGKAQVWVMELVALCPISLVAQWPFQWASIHTETGAAEWKAAIANLTCTCASPAFTSQKVSCEKGLFHYCTDLAPFLLTGLGTNLIKGMWKPF